MPDISDTFSPTPLSGPTFLPDKMEFVTGETKKQYPKTADLSGNPLVLSGNEWSICETVRKSIVKVEGHRDTFVDGEPADTTVSGSGFYVDSNGRIATAWHTIYSADSIAVCTPEGQTFSAHISALDRKSDLCIVEVDNLASAVSKGESFQSSKHLPLPLKADPIPSKNDLLYGFGFPHGNAEMLMSSGIMQGTRKQWEFDLSHDPLQISGENPARILLSMSMHIESAESGGPVINQNGEVVGVIGMSDYKSKTLATPARTLLDLLGKN